MSPTSILQFNFLTDLLIKPIDLELWTEDKEKWEKVVFTCSMYSITKNEKIHFLWFTLRLTGKLKIFYNFYKLGFQYHGLQWRFIER